MKEAFELFDRAGSGTRQTPAPSPRAAAVPGAHECVPRRLLMCRVAGVLPALRPLSHTAFSLGGRRQDLGGRLRHGGARGWPQPDGGGPLRRGRRRQGENPIEHTQELHAASRCPTRRGMTTEEEGEPRSPALLLRPR